MDDPVPVRVAVGVDVAVLVEEADGVPVLEVDIEAVDVREAVSVADARTHGLQTAEPTATYNPW